MAEDRRRSIYVEGWRIDLVERAGVDRLVPDTSIAQQVARALAAAGAHAPGSVTVVLSDDDELVDLNREHLGHDEPTDVLSFPMLEAGAFDLSGAKPPAARRTVRGRTHIGDIAISVERAIEQAEQGRGGQTGDVRWSAADELRLLLTHGTLHLCGWDHAEPDEEAAMRALERRLLGGSEA